MVGKTKSEALLFNHLINKYKELPENERKGQALIEVFKVGGICSFLTALEERGGYPEFKNRYSQLLFKYRDEETARYIAVAEICGYSESIISTDEMRNGQFNAILSRPCKYRTPEGKCTRHTDWVYCKPTCQMINDYGMCIDCKHGRSHDNDCNVEPWGRGTNCKVWGGQYESVTPPMRMDCVICNKSCGSDPLRMVRTDEGARLICDSCYKEAIERKEQSTTIYFIKNKSNGLIKMGTTKNIDQHLKALKAQHRAEFEVLYSGKGGFQTKALLQEILHLDNVQGNDWFKHSQDLEHVIDLLKSGNDHKILRQMYPINEAYGRYIRSGRNVI